MLDTLERLGLDPSRVRAQRDACRGIGAAYLRRAQSQEGADREMALFGAGTYLRRAAANSLLLSDTEQGRSLFHQAAEAYIAAGAAYGSFVEILGYPKQQRDHRLAGEPRNAADIWSLWSSVVVSQDSTRQADSVLSFRRQLDAYRTERVGLLGLPVALYLALFDAMVLSDTESAEGAIQEAVLPVLAAYAAAIRRCRADQYHWTRLALPLHPAEPDLVGILVGMDFWLRARGVSVSRVIIDMPIGADAVALLGGVLVQYSAWESG